ncbi:LacI family transcriptional regulator [Saccharopolyspora sp. K220]|uniref:LacI family DNA-binding transcriptional regulator n=1 Tax=Saccharopolyspora soli TaxID=2926618 RepID=UPI001F59DEA1|nr:LacI family DNA-binding transcriptional regulator [Saccharopolyspora soli]MCI2416141.1 LacI family transcriptional regulator [Saccharopolyspora soli]
MAAKVSRTRVRLTDVAELAQVSAATVSQVLNGKRPVSEATRNRVLDAVERLGYRPNQVARSLRTRRTNIAALAIPDITNPFYPVLARGMQDALGAAGIHVVVSNTDGDRVTQTTHLGDLVARGIDGIVYSGFHYTERDLAPVLEAGVPLVRLRGRVDPRLGDLVRSDDRKGAADATAHLLRRGYQRIGLLDASLAVSEDERAAGYRDAFAARGIEPDPDLVAAGDYSREGGRAAMRALLPRRPSAVVCANDLMAIGALDVAREAGLRVPDDLAVVGFDDIDAAELVSPALTTVRNPAYELGATSGRRLLERIEGDTSEPTETVVSADLIVRDST